MRITTTLALLGAAAFSLPAFAESNQPVAPAAGISELQPRPGADQRFGVEGSYSLADGRQLRVFNAHRKLYAELGGKRTEIVPSGQHQYASRDHLLVLQFDGEFATQVKVSLPASS